ncbi:MAG: hypothetical protein H6612_10900 [Ignavibacteriales bacterium]|nr:hypothetical protein [Ignavibacteriales bacterium]MCB9259844.1 hypothetical protein [Ignavibacteriales bacterium]
MKIKIIFYHFIFSLILISSINAQESIIWNIDRTDTIGGFPVEGLPDLPRIVETSKGKAALFNGIDQAMLIKNNPLGDAKEYTIEVIFKPDSSTNPINLEQRFLHVGNTPRTKSRILMEIRLLKKNQKWAFDSCISSDSSTSILLDTLSTEMLHSAGKWYNIAFVYKHHKITNYVNGVKELQGDVFFNPLPDAQISIGARQNPKSWFKGCIQSIRFTKRALRTEEFLIP